MGHVNREIVKFVGINIAIVSSRRRQIIMLANLVLEQIRVKRSTSAERRDFHLKVHNIFEIYLIYLILKPSWMQLLWFTS